MYLGRIYKIPLTKQTLTTTIFNKLSNHGSSQEIYDTIMLKDIFLIWKQNPNSNTFNPIYANVSLYIQKDTEFFPYPSYMTISRFKKKYCGEIVEASLKETVLAMQPISQAFIEDDYDDNGDCFFLSPIKIKAQTSYDHNMDGFGRGMEYYIVGVNFNKNI